MKTAPGAVGIGLSLILLQGCAADPARAAAAPAPAAAAAPAPGAVALAPAATPPSTPAPAPAPAAASTSAAANKDDVIATIANRPIKMHQLLQPLVEAHGLTVLLNLVQLELAKDAAEKQGITVTDADIAAERKETLDRLFAEADQKSQDKIDDAVRKNKPDDAERLRKDMERDHEQLFEQFLQNQKVTRPEFELFLKTNTYLRKIAEPKILAAITDQELKKSFEAEYGASVRVRHIQGNNAGELGRALERIRAGEPFEVVAKQVSRNPQTAGLGGELPRFSLATAGLPENFKIAAFELKEGEISNMVEADGAYHLIKLEQKFAPKAIKFESVKEIVRKNLMDRTVQVAVKKYRDSLAERARKELKISEPMMASQFADRLADRDKQILDQKEVKRQMEKDREREAEQAPKNPASAPSPVGAKQPNPDLLPLPAKLPGDTGEPINVPPAKPSDAPSRPGIVVPLPRREVSAPAPAPDPARATKPAQGTPSAPAGK